MEISDKRWFDKGFLNGLTEDQAAAEIEQAVYDASHLFERLEGAGKVRGNGHHMMQEVAAHAGRLMRERWKEPPKLAAEGTTDGGVLAGTNRTTGGWIGQP